VRYAVSLFSAQGQAVSLAVGAGKDHHIYVVNVNGLGGFNPSMDSIYQFMPNILPGGAWSSPAWFNGRLYYGGVSDSVKAFVFSGGMFSLESKSSNTFAYPGTTPSISANGSANGIVWAVDGSGSTEVLHAYDATNVATELYNSSKAWARDQFGAGNKYIVPTIARGKVYVGTTNSAGVFGLLSGSPTPPVNVNLTVF
jgi:hypothetical protein